MSAKILPFRRPGPRELTEEERARLQWLSLRSYAAKLYVAYARRLRARLEEKEREK